MKRSNRLLILLGFLFAISGALAAVAYVANGGGGGTGANAAASATPTPEPPVQVVVATQDINLGDTITSAMVGTKSMTISERDALGPGTYSSPDQVIGKIAGGQIKKDQVLIASQDFLNPGSIVEGKDIAGAIATGMVALSMELDQTNGVGTLIVPGDHVDIILTVYSDQLSISGAKDSSGNEVTLAAGQAVTSKMVIQNRKVLATLLPAAAANANPTAAPANGANGSAAPVAPAPSSALVQFSGRHMIVIVELTPGEAEVIRWAQRSEKTDPQNYIDLAFALRSSKDDAQPDAKTTGVTFKVLVDKWGVLPPDPRAIIPADISAGIRW